MADSSVTATDPVPTDAPRFPMPRAQRCPLDPAPDLRRLQARASIARVEIWDGSTPWLVSGYDDVRALLKDPRLSAAADHPNYPHSTPSRFMRDLGFLTVDDPEHIRLRRFVTKPFTLKRVETMRPAVQKIVDDLIDTMLTGPKPVDLVQAFALPVPSLVICELLGVPYADHDFFQDNTKALINPQATGTTAMVARQRLVDYIDRLITDKRTTPSDDLLSELAIEHVATSTLSQHEATMLGLLMLLAGYDTTANTIALGTLALLEHPDQLEVLRATENPQQIEAAVEELLRYVAVPQGGRRRVALADIEIGGVRIRAGDGLILAGDLANRDESVFTDPDRLDLRRPARRHLTFGLGSHQCLGQPLARVELQVACPTLFRRIPALRRAVDLDRIPFREPGMGIYGVHELPVTW